MDGAEEIQVWVERPEVLDRMSFDSSFIKEKKKYICSLYHYGILQNI